MLSGCKDNSPVTPEQDNSPKKPQTSFKKGDECILFNSQQKTLEEQRQKRLKVERLEKQLEAIREKHQITVIDRRTTEKDGLKPDDIIQMAKSIGVDPGVRISRLRNINGEMKLSFEIENVGFLTSLSIGKYDKIVSYDWNTGQLITRVYKVYSSAVAQKIDDVNNRVNRISLQHDVAIWSGGIWSPVSTAFQIIVPFSPNAFAATDIILSASNSNTTVPAWQATSRNEFSFSAGGSSVILRESFAP